MPWWLQTENDENSVRNYVASLSIFNSFLTSCWGQLICWEAKGELTARPHQLTFDCSRAAHFQTWTCSCTHALPCIVAPYHRPSCNSGLATNKEFSGLILCHKKVDFISGSPLMQTSKASQVFGINSNWHCRSAFYEWAGNVMPLSGLPCYIIFWIAILCLCQVCKFIPISVIQYYTYFCYG